MRAALTQIETNARGVLLSDDPEFLHQLRVGLRRLRSALRAFREILPGRQAKRLKGALRRLSPQLGAARDWDVLAARLAVAGADGELAARAAHGRAQAQRIARRAISAQEFARLVAEAKSLKAEESAQDLARFSAAALTRAHGKVTKQARGMDWRDPAPRHALRVRVKRLRYACEFFAPAFPARRASAYVAHLKALQEILGDLNDIAVGRRLVGFDADERALLTQLRTVWRRFARRQAFWRAAG